MCDSGKVKLEGMKEEIYPGNIYHGTLLTINDVLKYPNVWWKWNEVERQIPDIYEHIKNNIDLDWNWYLISTNNAPLEYIEWFIKCGKPLSFSSIPLYYKEKIIPLIEKYPNKPWDWDYLSFSKILPFKLVVDNPDKPWNWIYLFNDNKATKKDLQNYILKNPDKPWDWSNIYLNSKFPLDYMDKIPDSDNKWDILSFNENLTDDIIERYSDKPWNCECLILNKNLSNFYDKYIERYPLDFKNISGLEELFLETYLKYTDKDWNIDSLLSNTKLQKSLLMVMFHYFKKTPSLGKEILSFYQNHKEELERGRLAR